MKNVLLIVLVIFMLFSCDKENNESQIDSYRLKEIHIVIEEGQLYEKVLMTYTDDRLTHFIVYSSNNNVDFEKNNQGIITYYQNEMVLIMEHYYADDNEWKPYNKVMSVFDDDRIVTRDFYKYLNGVWQPEKNHTCTYTNGLLKKIVSHYESDDYGREDEYNEYFYEGGNIINSKEYSKNGGAWEEETMTTYTSTEGYISKHIISGNGNHLYKEEYSYTSNNQLSKFDVSHKLVDDISWGKIDTSTLTYNKHDLLKSYLGYGGS